MPRRSRRSRDARAPTKPRQGAEGDPRVALGGPLRHLFPAGLPTPPLAPPPPPEPPPPIAMTEREVMAAAYAGDELDFDRIDIVAFTPVAPSPQTIAGDPRDDDDAGDDDISVAPAPERQVPRVPLALGPWAGKAWRDHAVASPPLEVAALEERERELLADAARRPEVPTLRLRGMRRAPALVALADHVARARERGLAYLRVITGKGVDSPGAPILKEAVIAWCSGDGAAAVAEWAPERDRFGEYGSLLLRLRRRG